MIFAVTFYSSVARKPKGREKICVEDPLRVLLKVFINMSFRLGVNLGLGPIWGWDQFGSGANLELEPICDGANLGWGQFGADPIWDGANLDWDQFGSGPIWSGPIWVGPKCPGPIWGVIDTFLHYGCVRFLLYKKLALATRTSVR